MRWAPDSASSSASLTFDHPSIAALGAHLAATLAVAAPSAQPDAEPGAVAAAVQAVISEMLGPVGPDQARLHRMLRMPRVSRPGNRPVSRQLARRKRRIAIRNACMFDSMLNGGRSLPVSDAKLPRHTSAPSQRDSSVCPCSR